MGAWTLAPVLSLASALLGAIGTGVLFVSSYTLRQSAWLPTEAQLRDLDALNRRRRRAQYWGLGLLMAGFVVQAASVLAGLPWPS